MRLCDNSDKVAESDFWSHQNEEGGCVIKLVCSISNRIKLMNSTFCMMKSS